ncbi:hypothetical protein ACFLY1_00395 [Patescibacteria group bacterium]
MNIDKKVKIAAIALILIAVVAVAGIYAYVKDGMAPAPPMNLKISAATQADLQNLPVIDAATGKVTEPVR